MVKLNLVVYAPPLILLFNCQIPVGFVAPSTGNTSAIKSIVRLDPPEFVAQPLPLHRRAGEICCAPAAADVALIKETPEVSVWTVPKELVVISNLPAGLAPIPTLYPAIGNVAEVLPMVKGIISALDGKPVNIRISNRGSPAAGFQATNRAISVVPAP